MAGLASENPINIEYTLGGRWVMRAGEIAGKMRFRFHAFMHAAMAALNILILIGIFVLAPPAEPVWGVLLVTFTGSTFMFLFSILLFFERRVFYQIIEEKNRDNAHLLKEIETLKGGE